MVGAERFTPGILPFALRAALCAFKINPFDFVNSLKRVPLPTDLLINQAPSYEGLIN
jgi:hypothetical protein